jgi:hypothetical protein
MNLSRIWKKLPLCPIAATETYKMSGFTLSWSGAIPLWIIRAIPCGIASGMEVLENILTKPLKWPEYPLFFLISPNPIRPDGWRLTPTHLCCIKAN